MRLSKLKLKTKVQDTTNGNILTPLTAARVIQDELVCNSHDKAHSHFSCQTLPACQLLPFGDAEDPEDGHCAQESPSASAEVRGTFHRAF